MFLPNHYLAFCIDTNVNNRLLGLCHMFM